MHWTHDIALPHHGDMLQDLRPLFRSLRRDKAFTAGVILTFALVIGGNASVFTVFRSVLLRPLPLARPQELVYISIVRRESPEYPLNIPTFLDFQARNRSFAGMSAYSSWNVNFSGESDPERLPGIRVTANYFSNVGVHAMLGRTLLPEDDIPGHQKVVVLTAGLWRRRFGSDATVKGRTIRLNGEPYTVVGVLPPEFAFGYNTAELAAPLATDTDPSRNLRDSVASLRVIGRLKPGVRMNTAQEDLDSIASELRRQYPVTNGAWLGTRVVPLSGQIVANVRPVLLLLMASVGLVLLIACANITGLMLARAVSRQQELSVRMALGAGSARLFRQFVLESCVLTFAGGALGVLLARVAVPLLLALSPASLPRMQEVHVDTGVLLTVAAIACGAGLFVGVIAALQSIGGDIAAGLVSRSRGSTAGVSQNRSRNVFVVAEIALAMVLLVSAGLVLRSFIELSRVSPGFDTGHLLTTRLSLPGTRYKSAADVMLFRAQLAPALAAIPGVRAAGAVSILPLSGPLATADFLVVGRPNSGNLAKPVADYRMIDGGYFSAIGAPILEGRNFTDADRIDSAPVVIVNEALARGQWPQGSPIGAQLRMEIDDRLVEIVGVVADVRATSLNAPAEPAIFVPIPQAPQAAARFLTNSMFWVVRTAQEPAQLAEALGRAIHAVDPEVAAANRVGMDFYMDRALAEQLFTLRLLLVFAISALLLSSQGIYALISYTFATRSREIGICLALGATPVEMARHIAVYGMALALTGLFFGLVGCAALAQLVSAMLYKVKPWDPVTIAAVALVLVFTALVASFPAARRAMRVDPATVLRGV